MENRQVVEQYGSYVRSIARQIKKNVSFRVELDDLIQYGMAGLLEAAERFDQKQGVSFTTFSYYRIKGAMYDGLRGMGWVNRTEYQKIRFEEQATALLEQNSISKTDNLEDLANQVNNLVTIFVTSLEGLERQEFEDHRQPKQDDRLLDLELRANLQKALKKLPRADLELIQMYYFQNLSLEEVGKKIGVSKSWTCRKHAQVIERLSALMKAQSA
ncbi:MAG: sigma-70 family RNA polymerase sigma factor [Myxococcaceae bacterium]|nr:sigma-70 family RNA polymerase sigma factor [Myxococcaceae bacterium]MBH2006884.1 sigma-70 family RNA polymerase sigma factor [Myxococcaceae bacterium]